MVCLSMLCAVVAFAGCRSTAGGGASGERKVRRQAAAAEALPGIGLLLRADAPGVQTVQLYRTGSETNAPVLRLGTPDPATTSDVPGTDGLVLEFDLLGSHSENLSITFHHRDRYWRDMGVDPIRVLGGFYRDEIVDLEHARATRTSYVHYRYHFPNQNTRFLVSGNYLLRVTDRFEPDRILFERPFVVSEDRADLVFSVQPLLVPGRSMPFAQPIVRFRLPEDLSTSILDFETCFVRNATFSMARCRPTPTLIELPILHYYLDPALSFTPGSAVHHLDLTRIQAGMHIRTIDFASQPYRVTLEPDYLELGANQVGPVLFGQTVISSGGSDRVDADVAAEYVHVVFQLVPPENDNRPEDVRLAGSFSGWRTDTALPMRWNASAELFEAEVLLKQGLHEYTYLVDRSDAATPLVRGVFNPDYRYTALVYFSDPFLAIDRLIAHGSVEAR